MLLFHLLAVLATAALVVVILRDRRARALSRLQVHQLSQDNHRLTSENNRLRYDTVTGLLLRESWTTTASQMLPHLAHPAVLFVDVNKLKRVNDTISHRAGDRLLREIADRLRAQLGEQALLGRVGGDEFVALLDLPASWPATVQSAVDACQVEVAGRTCGAAFGLARPVDIVGRESPTAAAHAASRRLDRLMHAADLAMKRAKHRCRTENLATALELYGEKDPLVPEHLDHDPHARPRDAAVPAGDQHLQF
ncbi:MULTISPECIES: GGDEF domain-containing protein [Amycolatopsis]|uniref:Diguanylate cyclase (GGDEF) domain-containing protein n=1 Tax=Amycolatopsis saalfeldensis TaxID=394193 RepID=A0A1H8YQE4_9PSEU|nr:MULTISPECIES: GGDEF domain-containing protein [Amycolatopsis]SEP54435.1 diguanylate cyclase (GGDEF) domain-containing protein [Amycolatopsis saalfeldensis]